MPKFILLVGDVDKEVNRSGFAAFGPFDTEADAANFFAMLIGRLSTPAEIREFPEDFHLITPIYNPGSRPPEHFLFKE
jgi:hypothetical protein